MENVSGYVREKEKVKQVRPDWRIQVKVSKEFYDKFDEYCKRFRMTKSQFGNMCLQAGYNAIVRAVAPEELFTPEQLVKLAMAIEKEGVSVDLAKLLEGRK